MCRGVESDEDEAMVRLAKGGGGVCRKARHDVLAMASLNEGTPNVVMEAMSCGTPIAATAVGDIPEVVCDQRLGRTVPPRDPDALATAIVALLTDPPNRVYVAEHATEFQWEATLDDVTEILREAIG